MTSAVGRVLGVFAHPDDAEIWAGGTLLAHRGGGDDTAICILTHGDDERAAEGRRGAEALGARLTHLTFRDRGLAIDRTAIEAVAGVLAKERPNLVLTHWRDDSHPDHRAAWEITNAAIILAGAESDLRALLSCDTYDGVGIAGLFQPDYLVDVTEVWSAKLAAIHAHAGQGPEHYCRMIARQCALHGARGAVQYAEGFIHVPYIGRGRRARSSLWHFV